MIDADMLTIGLAILTPVYALLYKMTISITEMKDQLRTCKYCQKATEVK